ncbi:MAG: hypothetical protein MI863_04385 [Desulfobacterales bacterium]|nr:hypothetical protein [Desulfobacterales bacterium]
MDFDTLITYILLLLFFVLPSILKRRGKKKKPAANPPKKKKRLSLFNRVGNVIQDFVQELEKQAMEAKKEQAKKEGSVWDQLEEGDASFETREEIKEDWEGHEDYDSMPEYRPADPDPRFYDPEHPFVVPDKAPASQAAKITGKAPPPIPEEKQQESASGIRASIPSHALQQAVVWSEILGKPVALRQERGKP